MTLAAIGKAIVAHVNWALLSRSTAFIGQGISILQCSFPRTWTMKKEEQERESMKNEFFGQPSIATAAGKHTHANILTETIIGKLFPIGIRWSVDVGPIVVFIRNGKAAIGRLHVHDGMSWSMLCIGTCVVVKVRVVGKEWHVIFGKLGRGS